MSTDRTPAHFTISFAEWMRLLTAPMLSGPRHCSVTVSADRLDVRMGLGGWAFAASVHRSSIVDVRRVDRRVWAWGAHGWGGRWLVNGSSEGVVTATTTNKTKVTLSWLAIGIERGWTLSGTSRPSAPPARVRAT